MSLLDYDDPFTHRRQHSHRKRMYGLDAQTWYAMLEKQEGTCSICQLKPPVAVDHDHRTGAIRGLLCTTCNTILGHWQDDPKIALRAADYLNSGAPDAPSDNVE